MPESLAEIFRRTSVLTDFFKIVLQLEGNFPLNPEDMEALGQAYFDRYPEKFVQRNLEEVRLGYELMSFCLLEKALLGLPAGVKEFYRKAFATPEDIPVLIQGFLKSTEPGQLRTSFERLQTALSELKNMVDELPKGMIKERFLGGLSTLFNINYLLKIFIGRLGT